MATDTFEFKDHGCITRQKYEDYQTFIDKFKPKLTTDDCLTPPEVYNAVLEWINDNICSLEGKRILRPFYPGGNFTAEEYTPDTVVIDNPPFSFFAKIQSWYNERNIKYFLFSPGLTAFNSNRGMNTTVLIGNPVIFSNGAKVNIAFKTNMADDTAIILSPTLDNAIKEAQQQNKSNAPKLVWPDNIQNSARLKAYIKRLRSDYKIQHEECVFTSKACGRSIFGGGVYLNSRHTSALTELPPPPPPPPLKVLDMTEEDTEILTNLG